MSMDVGSVSVAPDLSAIGSGMAFALYGSRVTAMIASYGARWAAFDAATKLDILTAQADAATSDAEGLVPYLQANAVARVTTQSLGRTPNPNDPDTAIVHPIFTTDLPVF